MRHGQTTGDVEDRYGGDYEDHLTELGREQSHQLAQEMKDKGIEIIYSSPRVRAQEVAQVLSEKINCPVKTVDDWRERNNWGILTGMVKSEAKKKYPELVEFLIKNGFRHNLDGAEPYDFFRQRIEKAFEQLRQSKYSIVGVMTHGGPISLIFREILKQGEIKIGDCAWVKLEVLGNKINVLQKRGIETDKSF